MSDGTLNKDIAASLRAIAAKSFDGQALILAADHIEGDGRDLIRLRDELARLRQAAHELTAGGWP